MMFRSLVLFVVLVSTVVSAEQSGPTSDSSSPFLLEAFLLSDRDGDNRADPGDVIQYTMTGKGSFTFSIQPETPSLHFLPGSVEIRRGSAVVTEGNAKDDDHIEVLSHSPLGKQTIISFNAAVKENQPADIMYIGLQGMIDTGDGKQTRTSSSSSSSSLETIFPLDVYVDLNVILTGSIINGDEDGLVTPGALIEYTARVTNNGNQQSKDLWYFDEVSPKSSLLLDSITFESGTSYSKGSRVNISLGILQSKEMKEIRFRVQVDRFGHVENQGHACYSDIRNGKVCVISSDPLTDAPFTPTVIRCANEGPVVHATKSVGIGTVPTSVKMGKALPGDQLKYTIRINNLDSSPLHSLRFTDTIPSSTSLVFGSVTTTSGVVSQGNEIGTYTQVIIDCGTVQPGDEIVITFCVKIDETLTSECISNQGEVSWEGSNPSQVVTDDPATLPLNDPTIVCVDAGPILSATNTWKSLGSSLLPQPSDKICYTITILNTGASIASKVSYTQNIDPRATLVVGSVKSTCGNNVVSGNNPWTNGISVFIDQIATHQSCIITYDIQVKDPFPDNNLYISSQGLVSGANFGDLVTDDPTTPVWDDPTITPIDASPIISISKDDSLLVDIDFDGNVDPGDTILYTVIINNKGNAPAATVLLRDIPDPRTALVLGSVTTSQGKVTSGDSEFDTSVEINIGNLPGYSSVRASFSVIVASPFPIGERSVVNQAVLTYAIQGATFVVVSQDPNTPILDDPTTTYIDCSPSITSEIIASVKVDVNGDGSAGPGDTLEYIITVKNEGNQGASHLRLTDQLDSNTRLVLGSVRTSRTSSGVLSGNSAVDPTSYVEVNIGDLRGDGDSVTVTFSAIVLDTIPANVLYLENVAIITGDDNTITKSTTSLQTKIVDGFPSISVDLTASSSIATPGTVFQYKVLITNSGSREASNVYLTFPQFDNNAPFVLGSASTSQGTIVKGNSIRDTTLIVNFGGISAHGTAQVLFSVQIASPFPSDASTITLQAAVSGANFDDVLSTDPSSGLIDAPTVTTIQSSPEMILLKRYTLTQDVNKNGHVDTGDVVTYQLTVQNTGTQDGGEVVLSDNVPSGLLLLAGSVKTSQGVVVKGNGAGDARFDVQVVVNLGVVLGGGKGTVDVSFQAFVDSPWTICSNVVSNQASLSGNNFDTLLSDDPSTNLINDPTSFTLSQFPIVNAIRYTSPDDFNPVTPFTENLKITNSGGQDACNVVATLGVLGAVDVSSLSPSLGNAFYDQQADQIIWNVGVLDANVGVATLTFTWQLSDPCAEGDSTVVTGENFNTITIPGRQVGGTCNNRPRSAADVTLNSRITEEELPSISTSQSFWSSLRRWF